MPREGHHALFFQHTFADDLIPSVFIGRNRRPAQIRYHATTDRKSAVAEMTILGKALHAQLMLIGLAKHR